MVIKARKIPGVADDGSRFVEDDKAPRTQHGTRGKAAVGQRLVAHKPVLALSGFIHQIGRDNRYGRAARHQCFQVVAVTNTAAVLVGIHKFFHRKSQLDLVHTGVPDVARGRDELGAGAAPHADGGVGVGSVVDDPCHVSDGLYVVDHGGALVKALHRRERRFIARIAALAFQRFQQGGFLAADVRSAAGMHDQFEVIARPKNIFA